VLVCADGAPSRMAQQLGLVSGPAQTSCSRAYIEGGSHRFKADGVLFYNRSLLPGNAILPSVVAVVNIPSHTYLMQVMQFCSVMLMTS